MTTMMVEAREVRPGDVVEASARAPWGHLVVRWEVTATRLEYIEDTANMLPGVRLEPGDYWLITGIMRDPEPEGESQPIDFMWLTTDAGVEVERDDE